MFPAALALWLALHRGEAALPRRPEPDTEIALLTRAAACACPDAWQYARRRSPGCLVLVVVGVEVPGSTDTEGNEGGEYPPSILCFPDRNGPCGVAGLQYEGERLWPGRVVIVYVVLAERDPPTD